MITEREHDLILNVSTGRISKEEFLKKYSISLIDGKYVLELLETAYNEKSAVDVESAFALGISFDVFNKHHIRFFSTLLEAHWHYQHENIVRLLQDLKNPEAINCLYKTCQTYYEYLEYNDCYALIVKCTWALGDINTKKSKEKLELLAQSENEIIRDAAKKQLERDIW